MIDPALTGKTVIVTGANNPHGIGAATARAFAGQGARIFLHYFRSDGGVHGEGDPTTPGEAFYHRQQQVPGEVVAEAIRAAGGEAVAWEADLADPAVVPELFDRAEAAFGPVSVVVNNAAAWRADTFIPPSGPEQRTAGGLWPSLSQTFTAGVFDRIFAVNTRAIALITAEFARRHAERGDSWGRIINVSTDGARCFPSEVSYGASKLAMEGFTRSAAGELGRHGISVNAVSLGPIQTGWIDAPLERACREQNPLGRVGQPEDVADVIVFLASHQARWITGQVLHVGGGHTM